jgi:hypothetical protein
MSETELVERLERLERAHRRLKGFALAALVIVTALATIYATQPVSRKITAHRFEVVDDSGKLRVVIDATGAMPGIALFDVQHNVRALVGVDPLDSPSIVLSDALGKSRVSLGVTYGEPNILVNNEKSNAAMSVDASGLPRITLADAKGFEMDLGSTGKVNARTPAAKRTSAASIVMFSNDKERHVLWQAP